MSDETLILNVDDNEAARYTKTRVLQRGGYHVIEAHSGAEAIESVQRHRPGLVLLDVRLPDISGYQVCRRLKRDYPQLLVIQVSASFVEPGDRAHGLDSGADSYLTQPIEPVELLATVRALLRLRKAEDAARESDELYKAIVESATDYAILTTDLEGMIATASGGTKRVLGYDAIDVIGNSIDGFFTAEDLAAGIPASDRERAIKEGRAIGDRWQVRKDGSRFWSSGILVPLRSASNQVTGFISILRDQTAEKAHQDWLEREVSVRTRALTDANAQLRREIEERERAEDALRRAQKVEAVGEIAGGIAHDFNNMLTVVLGSTERLKHGLPADAADQHRRADLVIQAATQAASLTHRLLSFSRPQPTDAKPTDLNAVVVGLSDLLKSTLGERIALQIALDERIQPVLADANQFESAIVNLVVNSRDAMPDGGSVVIETKAEDDQAILSVTDTGIGMTPQVVARAFEPFFTTKGLGQGTGLGLAQVFRLAEQAGGTARIDSEPGAGTTVTLSFPAVGRHAQASNHVAATAYHPFSGAGRSALVVEDQESVRNFVIESLQQLGFAVEAVADAAAAVSLLRGAKAFDLMVSDIGLPGGMDGWELASHARRLQPKVKVVLMTGYARSSAAPLGPGLELMMKPFSHAALEVRLHRLLED